mmetsp:Transcript_2858/g.6475  ORF Transcript_2858/g.6475 Transcript_2858/m.6475 type:complete len:317 (-) Transcript_2858:147-1097(-)
MVSECFAFLSSALRSPTLASRAAAVPLAPTNSSRKDCIGSTSSSALNNWTRNSLCSSTHCCTRCPHSPSEAAAWCSICSMIDDISWLSLLRWSASLSARVCAASSSAFRCSRAVVSQCWVTSNCCRTLVSSVISQRVSTCHLIADSASHSSSRFARATVSPAASSTALDLATASPAFACATASAAVASARIVSADTTACGTQSVTGSSSGGGFLRLSRAARVADRRIPGLTEADRLGLWPLSLLSAAFFGLPTGNAAAGGDFALGCPTASSVARAAARSSAALARAEADWAARSCSSARSFSWAEAWRASCNSDRS